MRSLFLFAALLLTLTAPVAAKFNYNVKASSDAYSQLSNTTSLNRGQIWNSETTFELPLGFNFNFNGTATQKLYLTGSTIYAKRAAKQSGFVVLSTPLMDRGAIQGVSKSQVRFSTSGASGSRIFKLEFLGAGFEEEYLNNSELKDSINLQVWFHEGSNAIEYRFGASIVSNFDDYFDGKLLMGYMHNVDTMTGNFDKLYVLHGATNAPTLDSMVGRFDPTKGFGAVPAMGYTYRFTPRGATTGIDRVSAGTLASVFPTRCQNDLQIRNTGSSVLQTRIQAVNGRAILQAEARPGQTTIDLSNFASGHYLITLTDPGRNISETQRIEKF